MPQALTFYVIAKFFTRSVPIRHEQLQWLGSGRMQNDGKGNSKENRYEH